MILATSILLLVVFLILALTGAEKEHRRLRSFLPRALFTVVIVLFMAYAGLMALLCLAFGGAKDFYAVPAFFCWLLLFYIFISLIWRPRLIIKKQRKSLLSGFVLCAFVAGGYYLWEREEDKIPVLREDNIRLEHYLPFRPSSQLARLNRAASFNITENPPRLNGATALYPVMAAFVEAVYPPGDYVSDHSPLRLSGTPGAYQALIDGQADIIFAAAPSPAQKYYAAQAGHPLKLTPIGKEAFVFFVNSQNPVTNLTVKDLQNIYSGVIRNWQEVGGKNEPIRAFQRNGGSGSQSALERLMQGQKLMSPPIEDRPSGMGGMIEMTADYKNHANALGFSFRYFTAQMFFSGQIRLLSVNGIEPSLENIKNGRYPLTGDFYAVTAGTPANPHVQPFIDWILSREGQSLIEKTGYANIK